MSVAVVVVSYNRKELLRDCLTSVCAQVAPQDEVIVIDNGSTDGSPELVRGEFPQTTLFETGENLGGSGGFAWGVELAIAKGHSWAWLMDDDGTPAADALDNLKRVVTAAPTTPSFAACLVTGTPGSSSEHPPALTLETDTERLLEAADQGCIAVTHAIFVGVMINLGIAASMPLPYSDFFIWLDDLEYTRRLTQVAPGLLVPEAAIYHPIKAPARNDMGPRLYYYTRNKLWCTKLDTTATGLRSSLFVMTGYVVWHGLQQLVIAKDKGVWASSLARGVRDGVLRRPRQDHPGDLLRRNRREVPARPTV
ncbi:MAG TPA: glycosyltransferase [Propioniciclava sp.]|uniref:glycosyltransferase n=1 Tax=Propioniciclava sp. TaxID=2038686 RepID=UPI002B712863|nr:glycosyltransferase [Propioniciclava sp.]HRL48688.1 glycosyltransferase [Propioniciclava sp.]HRL81145.1 glycosyltransferase [Propioniciclava sp.]